MKLPFRSFSAYALIGIGVSVLALFLFFRNLKTPFNDSVQFRGPSGPPSIAGPTEQPPAPVINPLGNLTKFPDTAEIISYTVRINDNFDLEPKTIYAKKGTAIEITFAAKPRIRIANNAFDTEFFGPNESKTVVFAAPEKNLVFSVFAENEEVKVAEGAILSR